MNFLLRLAGSYVDAVLKSCYPLEQEPSMADLEAERLADKEAQEEVAEPRSGVNYWNATDWPETPGPQSEVTMTMADAMAISPFLDRIDHQTALLEDIRNILQSSAVSEAAAESPGEVVPPTSPGHPTLEYADLHAACSGISQWVHGDPCPPHNHTAWLATAERLYQYGNALEIRQ